MLRRRAKASGGAEQHKIAFDHGHGAAIPVPKLFVASSGEASPEAVVVMSPTSTLQTASATSPAAVNCGRSSGTAVPFSRRDGGGAGHDGGDSRWCKSHRPWDAKTVGLGLVVGALNGGNAAPGGDVVPAAAVLTGQKLRVQTNYYAPCSPPSTEFGIRSGRLAAAPADHLVAQHASPPRRCMSPREMEMSEDYTCVIARGPNPRTTHIFDNRVVESSGGFPAAEQLWAPGAGGGKDEYFLRYCHGCSKDLGQGKDIFMYRGEKAFCSRECRYHEMLFDDSTKEQP